MVVYQVKISLKHKTNNKLRWLASDMNFKLLHTGCLIAHGIGTFFGIKILQRVFAVICSTIFNFFRHHINASSNFATVIFFTVFNICRHHINSGSNFATVIIFTVFNICRHHINASSNFATVIFFTVFNICRHHINASSNFATVTFSPFSTSAGIV